MLEEARHALLFARATGGPQALSVRDALELATLGGAAVLGRAAEIGSLEPGKLADLALWRLDTLAHADIDDPVAALVLGARHHRWSCCWSTAGPWSSGTASSPSTSATWPVRPCRSTAPCSPRPGDDHDRHATTAPTTSPTRPAVAPPTTGASRAEASATARCAPTATSR